MPPHFAPRALARLACLIVFLPAAPRATAAGPEEPVAVTGKADPRLASFDRLMTRFVLENKLPGAALAVARNGRVVYARGFGHADPDRREPVQPRSLFRIASISKPITAAAVLRLVEQGRLGLDDRVVDHLDVRHGGAPVAPADPRLKQVTIRHLLQHRGGWDRDKSFDPMFRSLRIAREFGTRPPAGPGLVIASMWKRPLDFDPGARSVYSNFGYCLLGRVIEKASGVSYEEHVREHVLAPLGVRAMRIGETLPEGRAPLEVHYFTKRKRPGRAVVGPTIGAPVPWPYGGWYLEAMDAHGGWIASAPDLVRFGSAFAPPHLGTILDATSVRTAFARPEGRAGHQADGKPRQVYYGCGWQVRCDRQGRPMNTWHTGYLDGSTSILVRRHDGLVWAVLFNSDDTPGGESPAALIDPLVHTAADAVKEWPEGEE
jgi:CubicO group peptidase (beta-lactamase class C family)